MWLMRILGLADRADRREMASEVEALIEHGRRLDDVEREQRWQLLIEEQRVLGRRDANRGD
jgi:hypothetical protein